PEGEKEQAGVAETARVRPVRKVPLTAVLPQRDRFAGEVADQQAESAGVVPVGGVDSHARLALVGLAKRDSPLDAQLLEPFAALIDEEEIRPGVVCNRDVGPAVA